MVSVEEKYKQKKAYATGWVERAASGEQPDWPAPLLFAGCPIETLAALPHPSKKTKEVHATTALVGNFHGGRQGDCVIG